MPLGAGPAGRQTRVIIAIITDGPVVPRLNAASGFTWRQSAVRSFFGHPPRSALTMLVCHGWGETEADVVINLEVQRQVNRVEYESAQFPLTPIGLAELVDHGASIFLTCACWSGKPAFARAFLAAGYDCYIAPEKTADSFSAFQFVAVFAGSLLHEVRDWGAYPITTRQAYERAKSSDDY
jgi:hypothetical protein